MSIFNLHLWADEISGPEVRAIRDLHCAQIQKRKLELRTDWDAVAIMDICREGIDNVRAGIFADFSQQRYVDLLQSVVIGNGFSKGVVRVSIRPDEKMVMANSLRGLGRAVGGKKKSSFTIADVFQTERFKGTVCPVQTSSRQYFVTQSYKGNGVFLEHLQEADKYVDEGAMGTAVGGGQSVLFDDFKRGCEEFLTQNFLSFGDRKDFQKYMDDYKYASRKINSGIADYYRNDTGNILSVIPAECFRDFADLIDSIDGREAGMGWCKLSKMVAFANVAAAQKQADFLRFLSTSAGLLVSWKSKESFSSYASNLIEGLSNLPMESLPFIAALLEGLNVGVYYLNEIIACLAVLDINVIKSLDPSQLRALGELGAVNDTVRLLQTLRGIQLVKINIKNLFDRKIREIRESSRHADIHDFSRKKLTSGLALNQAVVACLQTEIAGIDLFPYEVVIVELLKIINKKNEKGTLGGTIEVAKEVIKVGEEIIEGHDIVAQKKLVEEDKRTVQIVYTYLRAFRSASLNFWLSAYLEESLDISDERKLKKIVSELKGRLVTKRSTPKHAADMLVSYITETLLTFRVSLDDYTGQIAVTHELVVDYFDAMIRPSL